MIYTRIFYPDGAGNIEGKGTVNKALGLPEEDLDDATTREELLRRLRLLRCLIRGLLVSRNILATLSFKLLTEFRGLLS